MSDRLIWSPFAAAWLAPDDWLDVQLAEASKREGFNFWFGNLPRRLRGRAVRVHGNDMRAGSLALYDNWIGDAA